MERSQTSSSTESQGATDPSQIDVEIEGVRFWSTFDSGNMKTAERDGAADLFRVWLSADCANAVGVTGGPGNKRPTRCGWFYFKVALQSKT